VTIILHAFNIYKYTATTDILMYTSDFGIGLFV